MQTCQSCEIGQLSKEFVPYVQIIGGQMVLVPDVPTLVCGHCNATVHESDFLKRFDNLVDRVVSNHTPTQPANNDENERSFLHEFLALAVQ